MDAEKVAFTGERETLLFTLYGKALESRSPDPVLPDPWAEQAIRRIDYDFDKLKVRSYESRIIAIRAREFDVQTARFVVEHPDSIVLHLGCGMDSRVFRVDPPPTVRWFDVDYPDVIDLRRRLYPERPGYTMIGAALEEPQWLAPVPAAGTALIVAEGVMMYLTEEIVGALLNRLTGHFGGGRLVFDAWNRLSLRNAQRRGIKGTGATFGWSLDDPASIKTLDDRLELVAEISARQLDAYARLPWWSRLMVQLADPFTTLRRANRILVYKF
ncbi:MAG: class I SAM-dependent methyltransferase [Caldilineaceae bacterium]|nr:class I SAM-dependent methyltransferase [Caldilineaceae bacterium]